MQLACQNSSTSPASSQSVALVLKDESVDFSMGSLIVVRNDVIGVYVFMYSVVFDFMKVCYVSVLLFHGDLMYGRICNYCLLGIEIADSVLGCIRLHR